MGRSHLARTVQTVQLIYSENENVPRVAVHPDVRDRPEASVWFSFCSKQLPENVMSLFFLKISGFIFRGENSL